MDISKVDKNFEIKKIDNQDVEWLEITDKNLTILGLFYDQKDGFYRLPKDVAKSLSDNLQYLSTHTTGGRVTFSTNSPFIALKGQVKDVAVMSNMALYGVYGFSVYEDDFFRGVVLPESLGGEKQSIQPNQIDSPKNQEYLTFEGKKDLSENKEKNICVRFPLYTAVKSLFVGIKKGCYVRKSVPFKDDKAIVFYGSSITHGACASRAGLDYASLVAKKFNSNFYNFGFAGNCKGELEIADYISTINAKLYVVEYDHNAPTMEFLKSTHYAFYKKLRAGQTDTPILFVSRPSTDYFNDYKERRQVVKDTYLKGRKDGDNLVYFLDGHKFYGKTDRTLCTADTCHPNDLGFYNMANTIIKFIEKNNIL